MRFSTTNSVSLTHSDIPLTISFKKAFLNLRSKLPRQHKVSPIKNDAHTVITVVPKRQYQASAKQQDVYHNLRNYYGHPESKQQQQQQQPVIEKSDREARHRIVKQYQQDTSAEHRHWKEYSSPSFVDINTDAPLRFQTHAYVRDTRVNTNFLRIAAIKKHAQHSSQIVLTNTDKPYLKKRTDEFQWARPSTLRREV
ncbi:hypothetical protein A0J61_04929 [Choanephora cucurbitarum]|uniref:Uncharacterized protein n=1 Tax=Choanephora cucurbitarum TaxID=101091 RepID=A0A1C7NDA0_9FUNG|nr:hypothetical protein A0J61_04929 [Choanephora cucurbitarum]